MTISYRKAKDRRQLFNWSPYCFYCGCQLQITKPARPNYATVDHFYPLILGGVDELENKVLACKKCNEFKSGNVVDDCFYSRLALFLSEDKGRIKVKKSKGKKRRAG